MDLEKEYSPSQCSHRAIDNNPADLIESFVKIHIEETERVKKVYKSRLDVSYGDTKMQSMDIYFKDKESDTPIFVYIHGGYWIELTKAESGICVAPLVERGYRVVVMDYDQCPNVTLEEIVQQTKKFLKFLLKYATDTNAESISFCGHSAGSYLIAMLFQQDCLDLPNANLIKDIFLISGIYDLREMRQTNAANPNNVLSLDEESAKRLSPALLEFSKSAVNIKIHVIFGEHDSEVFKKQSTEFFKQLEKQNLALEYSEVMDHDHFTIIEELRNSESSIMNFILKKLGLK
ncbi:kynurenine formamidase [Episyrphus balteatus]|uniref:kynurenine formamidase n=1 Tax=Episyrphus balteatus TaxID=286459 RepID=UPI0024851EAE|nr:kynurenine formamidase [Episyrphus balteatus]